MKKLLSIILILCLSLLLFCCNMRDNSTNKESSADNDIENNEIGDISSDISRDLNTSAGSTDENKKEEKMDQFVLKGIVKGFNTHLEIEVIESDYAFGIYWVIVPDNTPILDKDGDNIQLSSLKEGDIVKVTYNGQTMMSYPPQIVALKIEKSDTQSDFLY